MKFVKCLGISLLIFVTAVSQCVAKDNFQIKGKVLFNDNSPVKGATLFIVDYGRSSQDGENIIGITVTDIDGEFNFFLNNIKGEVELVLIPDRCDWLEQRSSIRRPNKVNELIMKTDFDYCN